MGLEKVVCIDDSEVHVRRWIDACDTNGEPVNSFCISNISTDESFPRVAPDPCTEVNVELREVKHEWCERCCVIG